MGEYPRYSSLSVFPGPSSYSVIAPFGAHIVAGSVKYTQFTADNSQMSSVSSFIRNETGASFNATKLMVAEWDGVSMDGGSSVSYGWVLYVCMSNYTAWLSRARARASRGLHISHSTVVLCI